MSDFWIDFQTHFMAHCWVANVEMETMFPLV